MGLDCSIWFEFAKAITKEEEINEELIMNELSGHKSVLQGGTSLYRARNINKNNESELNGFMHDTIFYGFPQHACGAPDPSDVKRDGRCNKVNESLLYLAEDMYTALAEVRPCKRQRVSIAEFTLTKDIDIVDIKYDDNHNPQTFFSWLAFSFYHVVNDREEDYKITRYITKMIKNMGYDGIRYSSSLSSEGLNVVLFNPSLTKCLGSKVYQTIALLHYAEEQMPRQDNERLLPKTVTDRFSQEDINWFLEQF